MKIKVSENFLELTKKFHAFSLKLLFLTNDIYSFFFIMQIFYYYHLEHSDNGNGH